VVVGEEAVARIAAAAGAAVEVRTAAAVGAEAAVRIVAATAERALPQRRLGKRNAILRTCG
jgi:hypothetical protein